jgi:threonine dehydratase
MPASPEPPPAAEPPPSGPAPVGREEIAAARARIVGHLRPTPSLVIDDLVDGPVVAKLDLLQPTGSFKVRGATALLTGVEVPEAGVVAASGGNFGLAIAWAARRLGHRASVFVPDSSPRAKIDRLRHLGAEVEVVPGFYADALARADAYVAATDALSAHAYDQREVVAGQGTSAVELLDEHPELDTVLVACGGGGLLAGVAGWLGGDVRVVAVETPGTAALHTARTAGRPVDVEVSGPAASALGARRVGTLAWSAQRWVHGAVLVDDADVAEAQRRLWETRRLLTEPGGAVAVAALTSGAYVPAPGERVAAIVCGANTDPGEVPVRR